MYTTAMLNRQTNYALTELVHDPVTNYIHYLYAI